MSLILRGYGEIGRLILRGYGRIVKVIIRLVSQIWGFAKLKSKIIWIDPIVLKSTTDFIAQKKSKLGDSQIAMLSDIDESAFLASPIREVVFFYTPLIEE